MTSDSHAEVRRDCPNCNGTGKVHDSMLRYPKTCGRCDGRGLIPDPDQQEQAEQREAALVEALREISEIDQDEWHATHGWKCVEFVRERARAALTVYEQSQGKP